MGYEAMAFCDFINGDRLDEYRKSGEICFNVHSCMDVIKQKANIKYN